MDTIENWEQIHKILQERDIEGRPLYFLMKQHPLLLFKIETTIELEWEGDIPLYRRESLFLSTMARIFGIRVERPLARDTKCVICAEAKSLHSSSASLAARPCSNTLPTLLKYSWSLSPCRFALFSPSRDRTELSTLTTQPILPRASLTQPEVP